MRIGVKLIVPGATGEHDPDFKVDAWPSSRSVSEGARRIVNRVDDLPTKLANLSGQAVKGALRAGAPPSIF